MNALRSKIRRIKKTEKRLHDMQLERESKRDSEFEKLLAELDYNHELMINLVKASHFELIMDELVAEREDPVDLDDNEAVF